MGFGADIPEYKPAPKTAPATTLQSEDVKQAGANERRRIALAYGRNRTTLGAGMLFGRNQNGKDILG